MKTTGIVYIQSATPMYQPNTLSSWANVSRLRPTHNTMPAIVRAILSNGVHLMRYLKVTSESSFVITYNTDVDLEHINNVLYRSPFICANTSEVDADHCLPEITTADFKKLHQPT